MPTKKLLEDEHHYGDSSEEEKHRSRRLSSGKGKKKKSKRGRKNKYVEERINPNDSTSRRTPMAILRRQLPRGATTLTSLGSLVVLPIRASPNERSSL